jgi:hypothetical protein
MQRTPIALICALAFAAGGAFAQQAAHKDTSTDTMAEKARHAAQTIGEKAKEAAGKVKEMAHEAAEKSKAATDNKTADAGDGEVSDKVRQMQKQADADLKTAKAKCDAIEPRAQKTVCEKQAEAAHANAEVRIAKANAAAHAGKTSTMGAGKSAQK